MNDVFRSAAWFQAASLDERASSLRARGGTPPEFDAELGRRELATWRAQPPFDSGDWFARRMAQSGLDEAGLVRLLGEPIEHVHARAGGRADWLADLEAAFSAPRSAGAWSIALSEAAPSVRSLRVLDVVEPLVRAARERLRARARELCARHPGAPFEADRVVDLLLAHVPWTLFAMMQRAMVLELNAARMRGELTAGSPDARFDEFLDGLRRPERALAFLREYPVLARRVARTLAKWERFGAEFLSHACADWGAIREAFGLEAAGRIARVDAGAGDVHGDGRSVLVVHFESGARAVYKPRSLAVDVHFQELLEWIERAGGPSFRRLRVLDRGRHGWVEFVEARPCASRDEVRGFYRRQGGLLALLYALEAIDFHYENLIAAGEHPVLIDLESLFHARPVATSIEEPDLRLVGEATDSSVLRIGILPQRAFARDEYAGIDLSGLGAVEGQLTPDLVLQWDGEGTDEMRARRERVAMPGGRNLPQLLGSDVSVIRFKSEIAEGFEETYRLLERHRDHLLSDDGPLARFADDEVRSVLRPTRSYGLLLQESNHPDHLRDALERERLFDRLWVGVAATPVLERVVEHERRDLENDDVPLFTTRPGSRDLWTSRGERIADYHEVSGLELVRRRVRGLGGADLRRQRWFIEATLATLEISRASLEWSSYPPVAIEERPDREALRRELVDAACRVGDRLIDLALRDGRDVAWVGLQYDEKTWSLAPLLEDMFSGVAGVIHFLIHLGAVTGEARYVEIAQAALVTYLRRLESVSSLVRVIGAFNGWGGAIYALSHWSVLWDRSDLAERASRIRDRVFDLVEADPHLDVIGGSAGLIAALRSLERAAPSPKNVELARRAGDRLVSRAVPIGRGVGWFTFIETDRPITGFSHGAAGISWSLAQLFAWTGDERYRDTALRAIEYERTRFVPEQGNWIEIGNDAAELTPAQKNGALSIAWCYGAPGIGLGRLRSLAALDDPRVREDLGIALRTTLERGFGRNHCICHGDLGNLDFVMQAARILGDPQLDAAALRIQAMVLASVRASGFLCGVPLGVQSPALMNGLAGIGLGLLRAAHPDRVPSVLALDPPR